MLFFYILEISLLVLAFVISFIVIKLKYSKTSDINSYTGYYNTRKINPIIRFIPFIILLVGAILIGCQFLFEYPQIDDVLTLNIGSKLDKHSIKMIYHNDNIFREDYIIGNIDTAKIGEYSAKIKVPFLGSYQEKPIKIVIKDIEAPNLALTYEDNSEVSYTVDLEHAGYKSVDNVDGDITEKVVVTKKEVSKNLVNVKYTSTDTSNNKTEITRTYRIVDDIPPVITLNGSVYQTIKINEAYEEQGATANDEIDGDLSANISIKSTVNTAIKGDYVVTYSATDKSGNTGTAERKVSVRDPSDTDGVVYLTFDDGPSSSSTPQILDILKEKGVHASFFIINYSEGNKPLIQREIDEGHTVCVHGYSHVYSEVYANDEAAMNNIYRLQNKIKEDFNYDTKYIRFPGGSSNTVSKSYSRGIMSRITERVLSEGYKYFDWNVGSGDAGGAKSSDDVYNNVIDGLSLDKANVVLMHDFGGNQKTIDALPRIIDYCLANGYRIEAINEYTPMAAHGINN